MERHALESDRLRLEPTTEQHAPLVYNDASDPALWTFFPDLRPKSLEQLRSLYKRWEGGNPDPASGETWENWVCFLRDTQTPVGGMQATIQPGGVALIAYMFYAAHHGNGYAREAAKRVIDNLQTEHGVTRVRAEIYTGNARSIKLAQALGFVRVEERIGSGPGPQARADEYVYELALDPVRL